MIKIAGPNTYIATNYDEYFSPQVFIGDYTSIAEHVVFCGSMNHVCVTHPEAVSTFNFHERWKVDYFDSGGVSRGPIHIGNDVWIGREAFIMDGVTIGDGAIIGARAVVSNDVPPYAVAVGSPIQVKKYRFTSQQIERLLAIQWWNWDRQTIIDRMADFRNIEQFVTKYYGH